MMAAAFKRVLAGLAWAAAATGAQAAQDVVIYSDSDYPPYAFAEGGKAAGIYAEMLAAAFKKLPDYAVTITPAPWKRGLAMVESGEAVGIVPPYYRPQMRPWMEPYSESLFEEVVVVMCTEAAAATRMGAAFPDGFTGLKFGNNAGFKSGGEPFQALITAGKITLDEAPNTRANLLKLLAGRVDCYINDRLAILSELGKLKVEKNELALAGSSKEAAAVSKESVHVGYSKAGPAKFPFMPDFITKLDAAIKEVKASGEFAKIVDAYLTK